MKILLFRIAACAALVGISKYSSADTFPEWQVRSFGIGSAPSISGSAQDPDGDGLSNLMEYALGTNPLISDTVGVSAPYFSNDKLTLSVSKPKNRSDILYFFQVAASAGNGWESGAQVEILPAVDMGDFETISARSVLPRTSASTRFIRLGVTLRDTDGNQNGVFDAWELLTYGHLGESGSGDSDGDGVPDREDAAPFNPAIGRISVSITTPAAGSNIP